MSQHIVLYKLRSLPFSEKEINKKHMINIYSQWFIFTISPLSLSKYAPIPLSQIYLITEIRKIFHKDFPLV